MGANPATGIKAEEFLQAVLELVRPACRPGAPEHADDLAVLQQGEVERYLRNAGGKSDDEEAPFPVHGPQHGLGIVATDTIIDHVDPAPAHALDGVGQLLLLRVVEVAGGIDQPVIGALLLRHGELVLAGHPGEDLRAHGLAELDRGHARPASRARHEELFARLQVGAILQREMCRAIGQHEGSGLLEGHVVGDRHTAAGIDHQLFLHPAPARQGQHPVAWLHIAHAFADGLDHACHLATRRERSVGLELVLVLDDQHVGIIHTHGMDAQQHVTLSGDGLRPVDQFQRVRSARRIRYQCPHARFLP